MTFGQLRFQSYHAARAGWPALRHVFDASSQLLRNRQLVLGGQNNLIGYFVLDIVTLFG